MSSGNLSHCGTSSLISHELTRSIMVLSRVSKDNQIPQIEKGIPSLHPSVPKMILDSVELCETEGCFLHIEFLGTNVRFPETHNVPPEVDINSRNVGVLKQSKYALFLNITYITILFRISIHSSVCHRVWSIFMINRASLFIDHRMSGFSNSCKVLTFQTIWKHTCDNCPTDFPFLLWSGWSSMHGVNTL